MAQPAPVACTSPYGSRERNFTAGGHEGRRGDRIGLGQPATRFWKTAVTFLNHQRSRRSAQRLNASTARSRESRILDLTPFFFATEIRPVSRAASILNLLCAGITRLAPSPLWLFGRLVPCSRCSASQPSRLLQPDELAGRCSLRPTLAVAPSLRA